MHFATRLCEVWRPEAIGVLSMTDADFENAYSALLSDVHAAACMESGLAGRSEVNRSKGVKRVDDVVGEKRPCSEVAARVLESCKRQRVRSRAQAAREDTSDAALSAAARFTDKFSLQSYGSFLHYVPRLVNIVTARCAPRGRRQSRCAPPPTDAPRPRAARRGHPDRQQWRFPAARPAPNRRSL